MRNIASEVKKRLLALPSAKTQVIEGASDDEIQELEVYAGGTLPAVYKEFLKELGRSAGDLFRGSDYALGQRFNLRLKGPSEDLLRRNTSFRLPQVAFVFLMTQGYQFAYFNRGESDDPDVHHYLEGDQSPKLLAAALSCYFERCIEACELREQRSGSGAVR